MYYLVAFALLNIMITLISGKPMEDQDRLPTTPSSHEYSGDIGGMEGETQFDFKSFLETLKADFLRNLNLSEVPSEEKMKEEPLQFLIDLYNRYSKDKSTSPRSNTVRSFSPKDITSLSPLEMNQFQKYILLFNVSIPWYEDVTTAELRIHTDCQKTTKRFANCKVNIAVYDVLGGNNWEKPNNVKSFLISKEIQECGWTMFDVSSTVKRWTKADKTMSTNQLEIVIESDVQSDLTCGNVHISVTPNSNHLPFLIVFSNDPSNRIKENYMELQEMIANQQKGMLKNLVKNNTAHKENALSVNGIHHLLSRGKRSAERDYCRRTSLLVDFKEIGWNWVIAPQVYDAFECKGGCFFPLTDHVSPTKHALVQTLVHLNNPKKAAKACCVPTKLDPISMLYQDVTGNPIFKFKYEGMKVAECGCR